MKKLARRDFFLTSATSVTSFAMGGAAAAEGQTPKLLVEVPDNQPVARFGKTNKGIEIRAAGDRVAIDGQGTGAVSEIITIEPDTGNIRFRNAPNTPDFEWNRPQQKLYVRSILMEDAADKCELALRRHEGSPPDGPRLPLDHGSVPGIIYWQAWGTNGDFDAAPGVPGRIATIEAQCIGQPTSTNRGGRLVFATTNQNTVDPQNRMWINDNGNVGIDTPSPQERLEVNGNIRCVSVQQTSDARFKKDIEPLSDSLEKVQQLQPVSFEWNERINGVLDGYKLNERCIGLIAQEVENVFPEMVKRSKFDDQIEDARTVAYDRLIPVLIGAIKELATRVAELEQTVQNKVAAQPALART